MSPPERNDDLDRKRGEPRKALLLRLSPPLAAELKRWAATEFRSLNAQIEYILQDAVRRRRGKE